MSANKYSFRMIRSESEEPLDTAERELLLERPVVKRGNALQRDAPHFVPGEQLETAINTALAVGEPLLITGEPGTGKTQAAYYAAYKLGLGDVLHFQVKSDSSAADLLYHFDSVRYFRDASLQTVRWRIPDHEKGDVVGDNKRSLTNEEIVELNKEPYVEKRALWTAFESELPRVLLIDEIDKAPRDFPNDLLHELDQMEFTVTETGKTIKPRNEGVRPIIFITSNSERRLPEPFLRRCVYHHIRFSEEIIIKAVESRRAEYEDLDQDFLDMAVQRFLALRQRNLRKRPSTGELLVWLRVIALKIGTQPERLDTDLTKLPFIGTLLKDHQDIEELSTHSQN
jgi:MoxR-like ATPase